MPRTYGPESFNALLLRVMERMMEEPSDLPVSLSESMSGQAEEKEIKR